MKYETALSESALGGRKGRLGRSTKNPLSDCQRCYRDKRKYKLFIKELF